MARNSSKVEVLVATMNQIDLSLFYTMNIQTDVIFCNQCDRNEITDTVINECRVRMISTDTKGVGINRNIGLQLSTAEICLLSDDDVIYIDGYEDIIVEQFDNHKNAACIAFNLNCNGGSVEIFKSDKRRYRSCGACKIAIKNASIKKHNINFNTLFGGGCKYSSGEDSLFCKDIIKKKLLFRTSTKFIGVTSKFSSTWFNGYNEKFYFDKGALVKARNPIIWRVAKYYLVIKLGCKSELSYKKIIKLMNLGAIAYKSSITYDDIFKAKIDA